MVLGDAQGKRVLQLYPGVRLNKIEPVVAPIIIEQPAPVEKKKPAKKVGTKHKTPEPKRVEQNKDEGQDK